MRWIVNWCYCPLWSINPRRDGYFLEAFDEEFAASYEISFLPSLHSMWKGCELNLEHFITWSKNWGSKIFIEALFHIWPKFCLILFAWSIVVPLWWMILLFVCKYALVTFKESKMFNLLTLTKSWNTYAISNEIRTGVFKF